MNKYLDISPEVKAALDEGRPVVALESTIISHGMPYPKNVETALLVEQTIRDNGAVPATIAVIGGRLKAGQPPRSARARRSRSRRRYHRHHHHDNCPHGGHQCLCHRRHRRRAPRR